MLRKNKLNIIGKDTNGILKISLSENIYRNFDADVYIDSVVDIIRKNNIPSFEEDYVYQFQDKNVLFKLDKISDFKDYTCEPIASHLYDFIYYVNTSDQYIKLDLDGEFISGRLKTDGANLAPRTILVLKLDRKNGYAIETDSNGEETKNYHKSVQDVTIDLEYNIYMSRLL